MAQILRVPEEGYPESPLRHRIIKMESVLRKAEKMLMLGEERERQGNVIAAKILKKRAKHAARHAMSLMGILMIEYGMNISSAAERARRVALASQGTNKHA